MSNRKSIRLKGYDYARDGYYFVTVDVQDKLKLLWNVKEGGHIGPPVQQVNSPVQQVNSPVQQVNSPVQQVNSPVRRVNQAGKLVEYWWREIPHHFNNVGIDEYVIMSDHVHGIIMINNVGVDRCVDPLGEMVQWFKTMTTNEYLKNVKLNNWPRFHNRLWQRNYYERIIRNEGELNRIRKYIKDNPKKADTPVRPYG